MELEKQVCSLKLAKKLDTLGADSKLFGHASFWYWYFDDTKKKWDLAWYQSDELVRTTKRTYSAFTVAELGEMLLPLIPVQIAKRWEAPSPKDQTIQTLGSVSDTTEADARAKMLVYLLEHKMIPPNGGRGD